LNTGASINHALDMIATNLKREKKDDVFYKIVTTISREPASKQNFNEVLLFF